MAQEWMRVSGSLGRASLDADHWITVAPEIT